MSINPLNRIPGGVQSPPGRSGVLNSQTYGNGDTVSYAYDNLGRVKTTEYSDGLTVNYDYNGEGNLYSVTSVEDGVTTKYISTHDSYDRPIYSEKQVNGTTTFQVSHEYDSNSRLTVATWHFPQMTSTPQNANTYSNRYGYNADTGLIGGMVSGIMGTSYTYDDLLRLTRIDSEIDVADREYTYRNINDEQTTNQVTKLNYPNLYGGFAFDYTYDNTGNIATYVAPGEAQMTYTYDQQGQLLSASNGTTTYSYTYDTTGNILNANGHSYTYGNSEWRDLLTAYDGQSITYDAIGNPTSYYNGTRWTFNWENGRRLASASGGGHNISYTYDLDGLRTSKTVDGVVYNYYYAGDQLVRMTYGNNILDFYYNAHGTPILLNCNGNLFYYITNLQGDVIRLVDIYGNIAAMYQYDPYGNVIQALGSHSQINPLRYRGYYYDNELGMYYLQSRYYDPKIGRFINADSYTSTGQGFIGYNMFAYCGDNPVRYIDALGRDFEEALITDDDQVELIPDPDGFAPANTGQSPQPASGSSGNSFNFNGLKSLRYMTKTGWSIETIAQAVSNGRIGVAENKANGNPASVYGHPEMAGHYVVIDDVTNSIVQLSNLKHAVWHPDSTITWC